MKRYLVNQRGIILVTTLLVLSLLLGAGTGAIVSTQTDLKISNNLRKNGKAFYIAQAGLNRAWHELVDGDAVNDFAGVAAAGGPVVLFNNTSFSAGSYTVTAQALAGSNPTRIRVISAGCIPAANPCPPGNSMAVTESQFQQDSLFSNALFAKEEINIAGGSITDSFDSRTGPYNPGTAGDDGNASSNGDIALAGASTIINGDATASGTVTPGGGTITGIMASGAVMAPVPASYSPCGSSYHDGTGITGGSYDSTNGQLTGSGHDNIILDDGVYCFSSIRLTGQSSLTVNGQVFVFLTADSNLSGGTIVNTTQLASNLVIQSSFSSSSQGVSVSGGSQAYMTINAPDARVQVVGASDVFGAIIGRKIDITGGSKFHYDKALEAQLDGPIQKVTWKEIL